MKTSILPIALATLITFSNYSFDWEYYISRYKLDKKHKISNYISAINHYMSHGIKEGKKGTQNSVNYTNFDWKYYNSHNKLNLPTKQAAINHYKTHGKNLNLPYCKNFSFAILLHAYNLDLLDEFINKINHFININNLNDYHIKINVPIDSNINNFKHNYLINNTDINSKFMLTKTLSPYHSHLINQNNFKKLYNIYEHITQKINLPKDRIQVMFSENRGVDIGGFLLMLDQTIKQNIKHDFIIKLHTKTNWGQRSLLTSVLNSKINKLCRKYKAIYSMKMHFPNPKHKYLNSLSSDVNNKNMAPFLNKFKLPLKTFNFAAGTMFLCSNHMTNFFKSQNILYLFQKLNLKYPANWGQREHKYERFFGYLIKHFKLKTLILDYMPEKENKDVYIG